MIDLYTWPTPNGRKISILLEELNTPYNVIPINISKEEQFSKKFSAKGSCRHERQEPLHVCGCHLRVVCPYAPRAAPSGDGCSLREHGCPRVGRESVSGGIGPRIGSDLPHGSITTAGSRDQSDTRRDQYRPSSCCVRDCVHDGWC